MLDTVFAWALLLFAPMIFAYAGSSDLFNMRISNRVALIFLLPFPFFAYGIALSFTDVALHIATGAGVLILFFFFWSRGWIGGGDAKFAAVASIWLGPELSLIFLALTSVYGAILSIFFALIRAKFLPAFMVKMEWVMRLYSVKKIPYGVALALAGLQIYAMSDWMQHGVTMLVS